MTFLFTLAATMILSAWTQNIFADELKDDLAALQGKWKGTVTTEQGMSIWTIENKGNKTKISIQKDGELVFSAAGEFKLEHAGPFKAFTYFNLEVKSGANAGQKHLTDGETQSSAYKLQDGQFITVGGLSKGDKTEPRLIRWSRDN